MRTTTLLTTTLSLLLAAGSARAAQNDIPLPNDHQTHKFSLHDNQFFLDNTSFRIMAGEIHPQRIPAEFWEDRIKKARAFGINTVSVYIFWNQMEPEDGKFDFTGMNDVKRFIQLCQDNGMWVALRPGPYVCAETEFGGFPYWLLKDRSMKLRADDPKFQEYQRRFLAKLHEQIGDLQVTHGGPILMVQVENELGAIDPYLAHLKDSFVSVGFDTQLYTCDHHVPIWSKIDGLPNVLRGYNGMVGTDSARIAQAMAVSKPQGYPIYAPEIYTAWFSVWGGKVAKKSIDTQLKEEAALIDRSNLSWCYYVFDGGTNFGFSNGGNYDGSSTTFQPVQTTYDYDAPVDEMGRVTPKYRAMRDMFIQKLNLKLPEVPPDPKIIEIPSITLQPAFTLAGSTPARTAHSENVLTMEDMDQAYGCTMYTKTFDQGVKGTLDLGLVDKTKKSGPTRASNYAIIMVNDKVVATACEGFGMESFNIPLNQPGAAKLQILVYNLGRNSVGIRQNISQMGLIANPLLDGKELTGWDIASYPLGTTPEAGITKSAQITQNQKQVSPTVYQGSFHLDATGETYIDLTNWGFGVVWVNGHVLGRYWDVGGSRSLYLPSVWQKAGDNQISILEFNQTPANPTIKGVTKLVETEPRPISGDQAKAAAIPNGSDQ